MRRIIVDSYGRPDVLRIQRCPDPEPGNGEVLVGVVAAGVNFLDIYQRTGAYTVRFPWVPGIEGSGVVLRVGPGVHGVGEGDRVAWSGNPGSYASHAVVAADRLVPVPEEVSLTDAAAALVQGMTAHMLASDVVSLTGSSVCLVHAGAGGVGGLLCQLVAAGGATVIATVSGPVKAAVARAAGARHVIDHTRERFTERVMQITDGRGVDVVYDAVGRDTFTDGLSCLRPRGTMVLYGQTSGPVAPLDPQVLHARGSVYLTKASLSHYDPTRSHLLRRAATVLGQVADGRLRVRVHATYPLHGAAAAHEALESRAVLGKVLLLPNVDND